ncbi:MarR family transcriptional regulator [Ktedonosporobacter rubrisoli]|uniref:MarR family transcriptional regulator n=1 Tax=Ktedonosporobacter rubrisoli TaxID=2509675 RepID=A0A4V0YY66_KTERU|nr:MarR family transcriptional regulator [Ktedonosporobacter rubrisoli]QBD75151.1 MarR family transcriptional regulator [Ktedonosporobacter rubrisoli]
MEEKVSPLPTTGSLLREVARLHLQLQRNCVAYCTGTTTTQCTVLTALGRSGPVTLIELSRRIGFDKSWTSRAVEQLAREGLIEKLPNSTDRRTICLSLSACGRERLAEINRTLNDLADQALAHIPVQEHETISTALHWLHKGLLELTEEKQLASDPPAEGGSLCGCD